MLTTTVCNWSIITGMDKKSDLSPIFMGGNNK